jgi:hypothetical protein
MRSQNKESEDFAKRVVRPGNLAVGLSPKCFDDLGYVTMLHAMSSNSYPYCACSEKFPMVFGFQNLEVAYIWRRLSGLLLAESNKLHSLHCSR